MKTPKSIRSSIEENISTEDIRRDSTLQSIDEISVILSDIESESINSMLALGVGAGALPAAISFCFDTSIVHGFDVNNDARKKASERGITAHDVDVESEPFPLEDDSMDLIMSFGLLEHLTWYDHLLSETKRVISEGGYILFAMPNMAGWTNRLSLLTGHQPRNVEFSKEKPFGIMDAYGADYTVGHVHTPTVGAFREFLCYHDFEPLDTVGLHPYQKRRLVAVVDRLVAWRPSLCRRFAVLAKYCPENSPS